MASRVQLIDALRTSDRSLTAAELAAACGLHVSTVRFHLDVLSDAGLVHSRSEPTGRRGRPQHLYAPAPGHHASSSGTGYQLLAGLLAAHWDGTADERAARAERAGRAAAGAQHVSAQQISGSPPRSLSLRAAVAEVAGTFAELGFEPEIVTEEAGGVQMRLHACPFQAVAEEHPEVVCSLHLGLIRGALRELGGAAVARSLEPFVEPHLCVARIVPADRTT